MLRGPYSQPHSRGPFCRRQHHYRRRRGARRQGCHRAESALPRQPTCCCGVAERISMPIAGSDKVRHRCATGISHISGSLRPLRILTPTSNEVLDFSQYGAGAIYRVRAAEQMPQSPSTATRATDRTRAFISRTSTRSPCRRTAIRSRCGRAANPPLPAIAWGTWTGDGRGLCAAVLCSGSGLPVRLEP